MVRQVSLFGMPPTAVPSITQVGGSMAIDTDYTDLAQGGPIAADTLETDVLIAMARGLAACLGGHFFNIVRGPDGSIRFEALSGEEQDRSALANDPALRVTLERIVDELERRDLTPEQVSQVDELPKLH